MISVERGLIRAFYPDHISCLRDSADEPFQDKELGLVCACKAILGFPDVPPEKTGALAASVTQKSETADAIWSHPDTQQALASAIAAMEDVPASEGGLKVDAQYDAQTAGVGPDPDDPPWDNPEQTAIAHEPVINEMPPEEPAPPEPHGSVGNSAVVPQDPIMAALDVIDPSRPYTPAEVEAQLIDIEARLERGQHFQRVWEERAYRTNLAWTLASNASLARLYREGVTAADVRKAMSITENQQAFEDKELAAMMVKAVRETMHNLRSSLSGYQSIARSVGATISGPHGYRT